MWVVNLVRIGFFFFQFQGYYCNPEGGVFACMDWTFGSSKIKVTINGFFFYIYHSSVILEHYVYVLYNTGNWKLSESNNVQFYKFYKFTVLQLHYEANFGKTFCIKK